MQHLLPFSRQTAGWEAQNKNGTIWKRKVSIVKVLLYCKVTLLFQLRGAVSQHGLFLLAWKCYTFTQLIPVRIKIAPCNNCFWGGGGEKQALNQNYFTNKQFVQFLLNSDSLRVTEKQMGFLIDLHHLVEKVKISFLQQIPNSNS